MSMFSNECLWQAFCTYVSFMFTCMHPSYSASQCIVNSAAPTFAQYSITEDSMYTVFSTARGFIGLTDTLQGSFYKHVRACQRKKTQVW